MTPAGPPADPARSAWHRRFPDHPLWTARLCLWRVELPVRSTPTSPLAEWIAKATGDGVPPPAARRLGLPAGVVAALHPGGRPSRQEFAFLDLPAGPRPVTVPIESFGPWPEPITVVPPAVLRPPGVEVIPMSGDWRTVPVVRAEAVDVVAVRVGETVRLYAADAPEADPLWELPADVLPPGATGPGRAIDRVAE